MLTYSLENINEPMYLYLYKCIKNDILTGKLKPKEKLPSKRTFAENNGISTITIQNAYDQLISEGYIFTLPKKGYFVANIEGMNVKKVKHDVDLNIQIPEKKDYICDFSSNEVNSERFPFSVWARMFREVISNEKEELLNVSTTSGVRELR